MTLDQNISIRLLLVVVAVIAALSGCALKRRSEAKAEAADKPGAEVDAPPFDPTTFEGRLVPANATDLHAPPNFFKLAGWQSDSSWIKLVDLVPEGTAVKEGEVVARFEFRGKDALPRVKERIRQVDADADKSALELEGQLRDLEVEQKKLDIAAEQARLDTLRGSVVSQRQLRLYELQYDEAKFEAAAVRRRMAALREQIASERAFWEQEKARVRGDMQTYERYERRFELRAPHDGVVRHAYNPRERRKMQKGDGTASGRHIISVARDETLCAQFFVPEQRLHELQLKDGITVLPVAGEGEFSGEIIKIDHFPQEMGFLREDDKLPNAREKAFVVTARFEKQPEALGAGAEVRVRRR